MKLLGLYRCDGNESTSFECNEIARFKVMHGGGVWFYCDRHSDEIDEHMRAHKGKVMVIALEQRQAEGG